MKILVTGAPKSGTTLLARLFCAFPDTEVNSHEQLLSTILGLKTTKSAYVGKRSWYTGFEFPLIEKFDAVVNIIRDGRDVTWRRPVPISCTNWVKAVRDLDDRADITIRYEDLVWDPDAVQRDVGQVIPELNLHDAYPWSDYPHFMPDDPHARGRQVQRYELRPISTDAIGTYSTPEYGNLGEFWEVMEQHGYAEPEP